MFASIVLLTRQAGPALDTLLATLFAQETREPFEVIAIDSGSSDGTVERLERWPVRLERISVGEFGFGRAKNRAAERASGRALVFLSQDALPIDSGWLSRLVGNLEPNLVAGSYGRQIPWPTTKPPEAYFLSQTYPSHRLVRRGPRPEAGGVAFSNVNSAIRREVWSQHPFDERLLMSEDQEWAYRVCRAGYEIVYDPDAAVRHAHSYSLGGLFRRSFDSGATLRSILPRSTSPITTRGPGYLAGELRYLAGRRAVHWIPYTLLYEASRLAGYLIGTQAHRLPLPLTRRLSWHSHLW